jgi:hypothetical protein
MPAPASNPALGLAQFALCVYLFSICFAISAGPVSEQTPTEEGIVQSQPKPHLTHFK